MRLLLTGDLHIGRSSSDIASRGLDLRASAAWSRIVDLALRERVDLVCLSGDVVDQANKIWEAIGPMENGLRRLGEADIETVAVAGNHDFDVLVRLHETLPDYFHLIGRSGTWERYSIVRDGQTALHIDGWSFPNSVVTYDPVAAYDLDADPSVPILGMVHGDLDAASSRYAPLSRARLLAAAPDAWLLGHIHKPQLIESSKWMLYPGSPQALDFGEEGEHGVWILDVTHQIGMPQIRPISNVRYDYLDIDLTDIADETRIESSIFSSVQNAAQDARTDYLRKLTLRLNLHGRTPLAHRIGEITTNLERDFDLMDREIRVEIDRINISVLPDINLEEYAGVRSAPGAVARLLIELDQPEPANDVDDLIRRTKNKLSDLDRNQHYSSLEQRGITEDVVREHLRTQARALLTELVQQTA